MKILQPRLSEVQPVDSCMNAESPNPNSRLYKVLHQEKTAKLCVTIVTRYKIVFWYCTRMYYFWHVPLIYHLHFTARCHNLYYYYLLHQMNVIIWLYFNLPGLLFSLASSTLNVFMIFSKPVSFCFYIPPLVLLNFSISRPMQIITFVQ